MNMPEFTAEASLYKTSGHYRTAGTSNTLVGSRGVLPQLQNLGWGTTREVCTACGCTLSFFNCDCGNSRRKLDCIRNGGPARGASVLETTFYKENARKADS
jgi:hypothetical protein